MIRLLIIVLALLVTSSASAQHAVVMDLGDSAFVILFDANGNTTIFPNASIVRQGGPPPTATNPYAVPSTTLRTAVDELTTIPLSRLDATAIAKVYADAASAMPAKTDALKQKIIDSGKSLGLKGKYLVAPEVIDQVLAKVLGLDVRATTVSDAAALRAVAWALWEAGR